MFKGSSTANSHIFPHKPLFSKTLPQNIQSSSHTKHVFSITLLYRKFIHSPSHPKHVFLRAFFHKESHILSPKNMPFSKALPQKIHISTHTNHAFFQRLFHRKFTHPLTQHMSFYMSSFNETKSAYVKALPRKGNPV